MTGMLASVANLTEARLAARSEVDIIDLKNPSAGALGALALDAVHAIVAEIGGIRPLSATVGDLPLEVAQVIPAVEAMAATGVDYVKIGFFPGGDRDGVLQALAPVAARGIRLIAVLFADQPFGLDWLPRLAAAGFTGVMLDTMDKRKGSLTTLASSGQLAAFVAKAREQGLLCGLAGSLTRADIPALRALAPDYLGFRGALCEGGRTRALDPDALLAVLRLIHPPAE